jgi:hypothetical protein
MLQIMRKTDKKCEVTTVSGLMLEIFSANYSPFIYQAALRTVCNKCHVQ